MRGRCVGGVRGSPRSGARSGRFERKCVGGAWEACEVGTRLEVGVSRALGGSTVVATTAVVLMAREWHSRALATSENSKDHHKGPQSLIVARQTDSRFTDQSEASP